jgi:glycosyltransferase involved in cell wall biosynthesis
VIKDKRVVVVMPAYNAESTLRKTFGEVPRPLVDEIILVDDGSQDRTVEVARELNLAVIVHEKNLGYGGNQKTCYREALSRGADIVIMLHPDYQYTPKLITAMASLIAENMFDCVLGSRILGIGALKGGMPLYKYISNRFLTLFQNLVIHHKLSEYHTGYRAFSREILETLPLERNEDGFIFDNQMLAQIVYAGFRVGEITCPTRYEPDSSSINLTNSITYGLGVMRTSVEFRLAKMGLKKSPIFSSLPALNRYNI